MKPVYKCDYCKFMGTEDEVKKHEPICMDNYDRKSCYTCTNRNFKSITQFSCNCGKEIPEGHIIEFCEKYDKKEKQNYDITNIFENLFGG